MASAEGLAQRAARGIGRTRGGAVVAPRDVFWWRSNAAPRRTLGSADDLICTQYGRISLPRRRLPRGVPVAGTCRTRVKVHACARLLSCAHRTRFAHFASRASSTISIGALCLRAFGTTYCTPCCGHLRDARRPAPLCLTSDASRSCWKHVSDMSLVSERMRRG